MSLIKVAMSVGRILVNAFLPSKLAPTTINASGVAREPILVIALKGIVGMCILNKETSNAERIPIIIGFFILCIYT